MRDKIAVIAGIVLLASAWTGPLAGTARTSFSAQMLTHMLVVAVVSPLFAIFLRPFLQARAALNRIAMLAFGSSLLDFVIIWAWHLPALHDYARYEGFMLFAEQASFLVGGIVVWTSALATYRTTERSAGLVGAGALFFTSMHMTLLGALLALASRPLYMSCLEGTKPFNISVQEDQQLGGVIMLVMGGLIYLVGGLVLAGAAISADRDLYLQEEERK